MQRLCSNAHGTLIPCGFTQPSDASSEDVSLWKPASLDHYTLKVDVATYLVKFVGEIFCRIVREEHRAVSWNKPDSMEFLLFFIFLYNAMYVWLIYILMLAASISKCLCIGQQLLIDICWHQRAAVASILHCDLRDED